MRVAWWTPMPPQATGIADSSFTLAAALAKDSSLSVVAVVEDRVAKNVRVPAGVGVVSAGDYESGAIPPCDLDVYHMGNNAGFHEYLHARALDHPGLVIIHDPAMADFYAALCGGFGTEMFLTEARYSEPSIGDRLPTILVDGRSEWDRSRLLMSRRLVEASLMTVVHCSWARDELARLSPGARVVEIPHGAILDPSAAVRPPEQGRAVFGTFGGVTPTKRVPAVLRAFARVSDDFPDARLIVTGRGEVQALVGDLRALVRYLSLGGKVRIAADVPVDNLQRDIESCDAVFALRWPTAFETSGVVMRALGARKPIVVSDVPQYRDFDDSFCWRVPVEPEAEAAGLEEIMRNVLERPELVVAAGAAAGDHIARTSTYQTIVGRLKEAFAECVALKRSTVPRHAGGDISPGVNVIADWLATTGLAEAARRSATALFDSRYPISAVNRPVKGVPRNDNRAPRWLWRRSQSHDNRIDIWYLNVNEFGWVSESELRPPDRNPYVVASWHWELPELATAYRSDVDRVDEIWVGSRFTADAFRGLTRRPVTVMPMVVEPAAATDLSRGDLGLPDEACLFLFSFDANSCMARKNPWAVVSAYRKAFGPAERNGPVRLVVKSINLHRLPEARARLAKEVASAGGLLIDEDLAQEEVHSLIAHSDVYVSLHRSEGFGLGMAEAMYLGRPVIATAYSGNMDFTTQSNSCLVGYRIRAIDQSDHGFNEGILTETYEMGQLWAEPDVDQAARWMRVLYENPLERARLGARGAETIRALYSSAAATRAMEDRLASIELETNAQLRGASAGVGAGRARRSVPAGAVERTVETDSARAAAVAVAFAELGAEADADPEAETVELCISTGAVIAGDPDSSVEVGPVMAASAPTGASGSASVAAASTFGTATLSSSATSAGTRRPGMRRKPGRNSV